MANKPLQSIKFPDLPDTYTIPVVDSTLAVSGAAADAKKTGDELAKKVNAVSGKGLSTNDFTTTEKNKLSGIESGANKTVIDSTLAVSGNAADAKAVGDALAVVDRNAYGAYIIPTASGPIAHFEDGADSIPMKDVLVHIEPVQAGSGDPSPDNVRPITGWTGASVTRRGKNLMGKPTAWTTRTQDGVTATLLEDGRVSVTGTGTNTGFAIISYNSVDLPAGTYIFNGQNNADVNKKLTLQLYNITDDAQIINKDTATDYTFTLDKPSQVAIRIGLRVGISVTDAILSPMIRHVSSADPTYEPYVSKTHTITFPSEAGTVYGGTLDVTTGELVVDRVSADIGERSIVTFSNGFAFATPSAIRKAAGKTGILCDIYKPVTKETSSLVDYEITGGNADASLYFKDSRFSTPEEAKAGLSGHYVCYPLETPQTYQLTPQEITSLLGENNVWADTGDSEVEYRANTELYITKKITEAVSALS